MKRIGFLINPVAGIGGQAGMKGSDDQAGRGGRSAPGVSKDSGQAGRAVPGEF